MSGKIKYTFEENFDGVMAGGHGQTNFDNAGWTTSGSNVVTNYTTSPAPLQGNYSLVINGTSYCRRGLGGNCTNLYFQLARIGTIHSQFQSVLYNYVGGWHQFGLVAGATANTVRIQHASAAVSAYSADTTALTLNQKYHVWLEYVASGVGASNGIGRLWMSTDGTKPGSPTVEMTNGTCEYAAGLGAITLNAFNGACITDRYLAANFLIGDNP